VGAGGVPGFTVVRVTRQPRGLVGVEERRL
jgi:hypothetical protein